ncbi:MAG: hypothetical protein WBG57_09010 [Ornithinimicrobium sp.]
MIAAPDCVEVLIIRFASHMIAGAALWAVLGGLRLSVIIAVLLTEHGASSADHDQARSPESVN